MDLEVQMDQNATCECCRVSSAEVTLRVSDTLVSLVPWGAKVAREIHVCRECQRNFTHVATGVAEEA